MQEFVKNCQECIKAKPAKPNTLVPPLEPIYDPCNGPEDILEIVGELPRSNGYSHILTACDYFSRYLFAIPIRKPDTKHIITDKGSAFTSQNVKFALPKC